MIVVSGTIQVDPANHDAAAEAMSTLVEETNKESGCISYGFFADLADAGTFRVFEEWQDQAALDNHFTEPHMASFMASLGDLGVRGTSINRYEVSDVSTLM